MKDWLKKLENSRQNTSVMDVTSYAEIIASDILYQYLTESLNITLASTESLQLPQEITEKFKEVIADARLEVAEQRRQNANQINMALQMIERTQVLEQQLTGQLSMEITK